PQIANQMLRVKYSFCLATEMLGGVLFCIFDLGPLQAYILMYKI
ncbi:MAG: hypothetical protein ACI822_001188, partial [Gammaproteobacteria bacterium]